MRIGFESPFRTTNRKSPVLLGPSIFAADLANHWLIADLRLSCHSTAPPARMRLSQCFRPSVTPGVSAAFWGLLLQGDVVKENEMAMKETPAQKMYKKMKAFDFSMVHRRLLLHEHYAPENVVRMEEEYRRWLSLALTTKGDERIPISREVDPFWHEHILFTKEYVEFGNKLIGKYIHHTPADARDIRELKGPYKRTLELYKKNFGIPDPKFWPIGSQICIKCCFTQCD
jgi:hypothetical protein